MYQKLSKSRSLRFSQLNINHAASTKTKSLFHVMLKFTSVLRFRIPVFAFPDFTKWSRTRMHDRSARIGIIACLLTAGVFYLEFVKSLTIIEPFWNFCTFSGSPLNGQWVVRYPPIFGSKPSPWFFPLLLHLNPHLRPHPLQHQVRWEGLFKGLQRQPRGGEWWEGGMGEEGGLKRWTAGGTELEMGNWSECNFYSTWLFNHLNNGGSHHYCVGRKVKVICKHRS